MSEFSGHITMSDGSHKSLTADEAKALLKNVELNEQRKIEAMPTEQSAINAMFDGFSRLHAFGWKSAMYCPKDGSLFDAIEAGSTGIFPCRYQGNWPDDTYCIEDGNDLWPAKPILFRVKKNDAP